MLLSVEMVPNSLVSTSKEEHRVTMWLHVEDLGAQNITIRILDLSNTRSAVIQPYPDKGLAIFLSKLAVAFHDSIDELAHVEIAFVGILLSNHFVLTEAMWSTTSS